MEKSTLYKVLLTIAVVIGGGGFLIYSSVGHAQHYRMVDELIDDGFIKWEGKELKVHGFVEAGSIVESVVGQVQHRTFVLQRNGKKIRIFNEGAQARHVQGSVRGRRDRPPDQGDRDGRSRRRHVQEATGAGWLSTARRCRASRHRRVERADGEVSVEV